MNFAGRARPFARVAVEDASQVPSARSAAVEVAQRSGMSEAGTDRIALATTELASNLHHHASGGELLVGLTSWGPEHSDDRVVLVALDRGPGVAHFERCLVDGFSTAGTMGTGLGAVRRLARDFDAYSEPGVGTVVCAEFAVSKTPVTSRPAFDTGSIGFPVGDETENGDACAAISSRSHLMVMLADGLGHGPLAAQASAAAVTELAMLGSGDPGAVLAGLNDSLAWTRGAAISLAHLELATARDGGDIVTAGLGNVSILVAGPDGSTKRIVTSHGTAGARAGIRVREAGAPFPPHGTLILHSDGLTTRWTLGERALLLRHSSQLIAAVLWRDHSRSTDDTMVMVVKARSEQAVV